MPIACLPWYDLLEIRPSTDTLWRHIAALLRERGLADVPDSLDRRADYESQWQNPRLLLGQACGYDVCGVNRHGLQIVGVPRYSLKGCVETTYRSFVVVREDSRYWCLSDLKQSRCVINSPQSHSGMNVLQSLIAPLAVGGRFFGSVAVSGSHEDSLAMIRSGQADIAAIDCVTYGLHELHRGHSLQGIRVIHQTQVVAAPPFITGVATPKHLLPILREAVGTAIELLETKTREELGLLGIEQACLSDYEEVNRLRTSAERVGYSELASQCFETVLP